MVIEMFYRILIFCLGLFSVVMGITFCVIYCGLFNLGFDLNMYFTFIFYHFEPYLIPIGIILLIFSLGFDNLWSSFIKRRKDRWHA